MPKTITLDNLKLTGTSTKTINLVPKKNATLSMKGVTNNVMVPMEKLIVKNNTAGYNYYINNETLEGNLDFFSTSSKKPSPARVLYSFVIPSPPQRIFQLLPHTPRGVCT